MSEKVVTVVVCDLPHKQDRHAVGQVTIDVCKIHSTLLNGKSQEPTKFECQGCGFQSATVKGIRMHQVMAKRGGRRGHKVAFDIETGEEV